MINTVPNCKSLWPLNYNGYNTTCHLFLGNIFHRYACMALMNKYKYGWNVTNEINGQWNQWAR